MMGDENFMNLAGRKMKPKVLSMRFLYGQAEPST